MLRTLTPAPSCDAESQYSDGGREAPSPPYVVDVSRKPWFSNVSAGGCDDDATDAADAAAGTDADAAVGMPSTWAEPGGGGGGGPAPKCDDV